MIVPCVIGRNDLTNQSMTYDITPRELHNSDSVDLAESLDGIDNA